MGLALKGLRIWKITSASDQPIFVQWERFEAEKVMACKSCQVCKSAENYTTWQNEKKNHHRCNRTTKKKSGAIFSVCTCEQKLNWKWWNTLFFSFFYKHTVKLGWSSVCLRFSRFESEIMLDGMLNFKTHYVVWYCVWYEHCNGLFNIWNLVSSLILMFVRICLCDMFFTLDLGRNESD